MNNVRELRREIRSLRDRFARLSGTVLRINSSLDLDTVLREVLDSARALTGATQGAMTTVDADGRLADFVTSGLSEEEVGALVAWPDGPRLFEHLRDIERPFQLADLPGYFESLGFPPGPWSTRTMQGAPMRHRDEHVGTFFVGDKANGEAFTPEDEEILVLFASQAAAAIVNARTHREVERARADLEALVETSPVGVVVLEAGSGRVASVNREVLRIVEGIRTAGSETEQLLEVVTCRLTDGREFALADLPLAGLLEGAAPMRAEEVELSVPDGRSVRTLMNVTPIRSGDEGKLVSVVVTMQDLAPFEELERQRAGFLRLVSHELRAPLASIKGSAGTVLEATDRASRAEMIEFFRLIDGQASHMRGLVANLLDAGSIEAGTLTVAPEPTSVASLVDRARTTFLSGGSRHPVLVELPPGLPLAMADRERIAQVLNNLFANAARHAPSSSPIRVEAVRDGAHVAISVSDEGGGIPPEQLPHLFRKARPGPGGRTGLGLAIAKGLVEAHGGRIRAESAGPGLGARFTFTLPAAADEAAATGGTVPERRPSVGRERTRVLVLDDDPLMLRFVRDALASAGWTALATGDPRELGHLIEAKRPDLVLLDLVLPGTDGIDLMKRIPELPVIFISGYGNDETVARALELGAADYVVKPFSPTELVARIRAVLRRRAGPEAFALGELRVRYDQRRVTMAGRKVELTATEYDLLRVLSQNAGRVLTYERVLRTVWGKRGGGNPGPVRTYVKKLRDKLGDDAANPAYILTERRVGYRMPEPGSGGTASA